MGGAAGRACVCGGGGGCAAALQGLAAVTAAHARTGCTRPHHAARTLKSLNTSAWCVRAGHVARHGGPRVQGPAPRGHDARGQGRVRAPGAEGRGAGAGARGSGGPACRAGRARTAGARAEATRACLHTPTRPLPHLPAHSSTHVRARPRRAAPSPCATSRTPARCASRTWPSTATGTLRPAAPSRGRRWRTPARRRSPTSPTTQAPSPRRRRCVRGNAAVLHVCVRAHESQHACACERAGTNAACGRPCAQGESRPRIKGDSTQWGTTYDDMNLR